MSRHLLVLATLLSACSDWVIEPIGADRDRSVPPPPVNPVQLDRVVQVPEPAVDVLFVVDNSCSMEEEQNALAQNFPAFMSFFEGSGLDWHIGVVSTDMWDPNHSGKLRQISGFNYIDSSTPNPYQVFSQMAVMGTGGDSEEQGRAAAYTALELRVDGPRNAGFYREDAALHMVFISDEDDQSGANPITRSEFQEWMATKKASPEMVTAHAIIWKPQTACSDAMEIGGTYANYANTTGGILFDICEDDWLPFMEELGLQTSGLKREFFLSKIPIVDTLDVKVVVPDANGSGAPVTIGFETCPIGEGCETAYLPGRNSVVFLDYVPPSLAQVQISYAIAEQYSAQ